MLSEKECKKVENKVWVDEFIKLRNETNLSRKEFGTLIGFKNPQVRVSEIENARVNVSNHVKASLKLIQRLIYSGWNF